jgi:hypothetical protein
MKLHLVVIAGILTLSYHNECKDAFMVQIASKSVLKRRWLSVLFNLKLYNGKQCDHVYYAFVHNLSNISTLSIIMLWIAIAERNCCYLIPHKRDSVPCMSKRNTF